MTLRGAVVAEEEREDAERRARLEKYAISHVTVRDSPTRSPISCACWIGGIVQGPDEFYPVSVRLGLVAARRRPDRPRTGGVGTGAGAFRMEKPPKQSTQPSVPVTADVLTQLRYEYAARIDQIEAAYTAGAMSPKTANRELSALVRSYVNEYPASKRPCCRCLTSSNWAYTRP